MNGIRSIQLSVVALMCTLGVTSPWPAATAVLAVTDCGATTPSGALGQLRRAINDAQPTGDIILLPACTITLTGTAGEDSNAGGDLDIAKNLVIQGAGPGRTIIHGGDIDRVIHILVGGVLTLSGLTVTGGSVNVVGPSSAGSGIENAGVATLRDVEIVRNQGTAMTGGEVGGIRNTGMLLLTDVTLSLALAIGGPFGIPFGAGGLTNSGTAVLTNVTVTSNSSTGIRNAGILVMTNVTVSEHVERPVIGIMNEGDALLTNVTLADNRERLGDPSFGIVNSGTLRLRNSVLSRNGVTNCSGPITSLGHNLENGATCGFAGPGDISNTDPRLGRLQNNGGPTLTHALQPGSPAIDAGDDAACPATDQRGRPRPVDGAGDPLPHCDIGAVEAGPALRVTTGPGAGGGPHVRLFRVDGAGVASPIGPGFMAYDPAFAGGVQATLTEVAGDLYIVTGPGPGGGPHVRLFKVTDLVAGTVAPVGPGFLAYTPSFAGGVRVAATTDGAGTLLIVTGPGPGGGPHVRVFQVTDLTTGAVAPLGPGLMAYDPSFAGGVTVGAE